MTTPQMIRDTSGGLVQALCPNSTVNGVVNVSSARIALPDPIDLVRIASNVDCYLQFGDSNITATTSSMLFPAGAEIFSTPGPDITHVAFLLVGSTAGIISVTRMK